MTPTEDTTHSAAGSSRTTRSPRAPATARHSTSTGSITDAPPSAESTTVPASSKHEHESDSETDTVATVASEPGTLLASTDTRSSIMTLRLGPGKHTIQTPDGEYELQINAPTSVRRPAAPSPESSTRSSRSISSVTQGEGPVGRPAHLPRNTAASAQPSASPSAVASVPITEGAGNDDSSDSTRGPPSPRLRGSTEHRDSRAEGTASQLNGNAVDPGQPESPYRTKHEGAKASGRSNQLNGDIAGP
ncbi:hypothetical protein IAT40_004030 [Kwoniella sp. CBS 6097]